VTSPNRVTARAKAKVEQPFRQVKAAHKAPHHFRKPTIFTALLDDYVGAGAAFRA